MTGLIPQHLVDQIIEQSDIIEIVAEHVQLKKAGTNYKGLCPFHGEKTPSFVVSPQKQIYHCFGCGAGGGVVSFLMNLHKTSFKETLESLARRAHIILPKQSTGLHSKLDIFYKINSYAQWFFQNEFLKNKEARHYVAERNFSETMIKTFGVGLAPANGQMLPDFFQVKKIPSSQALALGLLKQNPDTKNIYSFFRERLMFPIHNAQGKIIGFGGRDLTNRSPAKYINSPESPVYNKSLELYGFYQAKKNILQKSRAVVVEGYVDVLACHQLGIDDAVAPLGTSITEKQVKILSKAAAQIILMFDSDDAGQKAMLRAAKICLQQQVHPKIVLLPQGLDPGDFLKKDNGREQLHVLIQNSIHFMDWIFSGFVKKVTQNPAERAQVIQSLGQWLDFLHQPIEKMEYQKKIAQFFEIPEAQSAKIFGSHRKMSAVLNRDNTTKEMNLEKILLSLYLHNQAPPQQSDWQTLFKKFSDPNLQKLALFLQDFFEKGETFDAQETINKLPLLFQPALTEILLEFDVGAFDYNLEDCVRKFLKQQHKRALQEITAQIMDTELKKEGDLQQLLEQKQRLLKESF